MTGPLNRYFHNEIKAHPLCFADGDFTVLRRVAVGKRKERKNAQ
jgi:hypothetical protein